MQKLYGKVMNMSALCKNDIELFKRSVKAARTGDLTTGKKRIAAALCWMVDVPEPFSQLYFLGIQVLYVVS